MLNKTGIYKIFNKINSKIYYGSTTNNFKARWKHHKQQLKNNFHDNEYLQRAANKYGIDAFEFSIVLLCDPENCLYYEQLFLDKYFDNCKNCYNMSKVAGSTLGYKHSEATKKKMSHAKKGKLSNHFGKVHSYETKQKLSELGKNRKHTDKTRIKMSEAHKGEKNSMFGKTFSIEHRNKIGQAGKGNIHMLGKKHSPETLTKLSMAHSGENNGMFGKKHSPEAIEKMRKAKIGNRNRSKGKKTR